VYDTLTPIFFRKCCDGHAVEKKGSNSCIRTLSSNVNYTLFLLFGKREMKNTTFFSMNILMTTLLSLCSRPINWLLPCYGFKYSTTSLL